MWKSIVNYSGCFHKVNIHVTCVFRKASNTYSFFNTNIIFVYFVTTVHYYNSGKVEVCFNEVEMIEYISLFIVQCSNEVTY